MEVNVHKKKQNKNVKVMISIRPIIDKETFCRTIILSLKNLPLYITQTLKLPLCLSGNVKKWEKELKMLLGKLIVFSAEINLLSARHCSCIISYAFKESNCAPI